MTAPWFAPGRRHAFSRLVGFLLGVVLPCGVTACDGGTATARDGGTIDRIVATVISAQGPDGFFVFSVHDTNPPVIAETYFGVVTLRSLNSPVPNVARLTASLERLSNNAILRLNAGHPSLEPRDLYELSMLRLMLGRPADSALVRGYVPRLQAVALKTDHAIESLRNWYFAVLTLALTGHLTAQVAAAIQSALRPLLMRARALPAPAASLASSLVVDAAVLSGSRITPDDREIALRNAGVADVPRSFKPGYASDVLTTFYTVIMAMDVEATPDLDRAAIGAWVDHRRDGGSYSMANGQPATPLAMAYALDLGNLLHGGILSEAPR